MFANDPKATLALHYRNDFNVGFGIDGRLVWSSRFFANEGCGWRHVGGL